MLKTAVKSLAGILGFTIIRSDALSWALGRSNPFAEQKRLAGLGPLTIFDVGAYIGEISKVYAELFPAAQVYSFEPFFGSFEQLKRNMTSFPNVHVYNMGLLDRGGRQQFYSNTFAPTNSLLEPDSAADKTWGKGVVQTQALIECEFATLDEFIEKNNIAKVDILKMDVQGTETRVLTGATKALNEGRIAVIYSEIITMPTYKDQKKLWEILRAFDEHGMVLHNVYNLQFQDDGTIKQFDAIFVRRCPQAT